MNMIYKEATTHKAFECEVLFCLEKPKKTFFLFKHLILDCGVIDDGQKPIISTFSQAEAFIIEWYNSGRWLKTCGNDKDREEWCKYINDTSAFEEIEIRKMKKTWFIFLQNPQDFMNSLDVYWLQVDSKLRIRVESLKRPIINKQRVLVAIPSKEKNQYGCYILTDDMKEQAVSIVRDYYSYALKNENFNVDIELSIDRKHKDCVICVDR